MDGYPVDSDELENLYALLRRRIEEGWTFEKIEPMSTAEILARLKRLGIPLTEDRFREDASRHESAERMADEWCTRHRFRPEQHYDDDFLWMSAIVLWKRLIPDRVCVEQIGQRMEDGYELLRAGHTAEACDAWWEVWGWVKAMVTPERNTLDALEEVFRGMGPVSEWCQDFEMELGNAGLDDPAYHRMRIRYCREFMETFSGMEWSLRGTLLRAEAEAHWRLGDRETAEARFESLIQENPDWAWGYIGWADEYWLCHGSPKDYARGEAILKRALARPNLEEQRDVLDRLQDMRAERKRARQAQTRKTGRKGQGGTRPPRKRKRRQP